jgi:hypothetical protein
MLGDSPARSMEPGGGIPMFSCSRVQPAQIAPRALRTANSFCNVWRVFQHYLHVEYMPSTIPSTGQRFNSTAE